MPAEPRRLPEPKDAAQRLVDRRLRQMAEDLRTVLDLDAGLDEIRVGQQLESLVSDLRGVLDLDAGLRDILGPATSRSPAAGAAEPGAGEGRIHGGQNAAVLVAILAARTDDAVRTALDLLARARAGELARVVDCARDLVDGLAFKGADAITYARARALGGIDARSLVDELAEALQGIDAFAHVDRDADLDACAAACRHAQALSRTLARTRAGINALNRACAHSDAKVNAFAQVLVDAASRALDNAGTLAQTLADALADAPADTGDLRSRPAHARAQSAALASSLLALFDGVLTRGLSWALAGVDLEHLSPEQIDAFLDDFTDADLSTIGLTDVDLTGLRWSEATQWPPKFLATIRLNSRETSPGSGVFEVVGDQKGVACAP